MMWRFPFMYPDKNKKDDKREVNLSGVIIVWTIVLLFVAVVVAIKG